MLTSVKECVVFLGPLNMNYKRLCYQEREASSNDELMFYDCMLRCSLQYQ